MTIETVETEQWRTLVAADARPNLMVRVHFSMGGYEKAETCEVPGIRNFPELLVALNEHKFISFVVEGDEEPSYVNTAHIVVVEPANQRI